MYMGQLSNGLEAISYFQNGVNLMLSEYESTTIIATTKAITMSTSTTATIHLKPVIESKENPKKEIHNELLFNKNNLTFKLQQIPKSMY